MDPGRRPLGVQAQRVEGGQEGEDARQRVDSREAEDVEDLCLCQDGSSDRGGSKGALGGRQAVVRAGDGPAYM